MKSLFNNFKKYRATKFGKPSAAGLTIIESLVAISILVIAVLGPLVIISQALKTSFFARDQMTAYYLANESIEHVRNLRDFNALTRMNPAEWLYGITAGETSPVISSIDDPNPKKYTLVRGTNGYELQACPNNICPKLKLNKVNGTYGETTGANINDSIYTREIVFYQAPGDETAQQEITIQALIKWNQIGGTYQFKLRENLTNWKIQNFDVN